MSLKKIAMAVMLGITLLLFTGCRDLVNGLVGTTEETVPEQYPVGAIFPVYADEAAGIKSREIQLSDFTFTIPEGYVYGKVERENYSIYYVWQDKAEKEYALELDSDNMLYIYEGLDVSSPHQVISDRQALQSIKGAYVANFHTAVSGKSFIVDPVVYKSKDGRYYVASFEGKSGDYLTTTYMTLCFPKTYYGIYGVERETATGHRRYYGFIFSNDGRGEVFTKNEYESLLGQVKTNLAVERFYTLHDTDSVFYDPAADVSNGRSYEQLVMPPDVEGGSDVEGLFYNSLLYYVETIGRSYERENVDANKAEVIEATEPQTEKPTEAPTEAPDETEALEASDATETAEEPSAAELSATENASEPSVSANGS